ncbi:GNAT family N-acetyltransferase [Schlesneria sp. T3-172]|uniref:GNAT family N-acetyltransferase n=1 Tax=Schlesneria sphaerica TaxID=3373610 RepID=UPI0037C5BD77
MEENLGDQVDIRIRVAVAEDCDVISEFNKRLAHETENKSLSHDQITRGVRTLLENPQHGRYFVAQIGGEIIGQLMHTREWSDWRNGEIWWLQSVYVLPEFRRRGVFRRLFQYLEELARQTPGVIGLRLYAEEHNAAALNVYATLGLTHAGYVVLERFFERNG